MPPRSILSLLVVTLSLTAVLAQTVARANTCCGLMSGKIYCYGGVVFVNAIENKGDNVMNVMDITNSTAASASTLQNMWKTVSYIADGVDLTPRTDPECLVTGQNRMIINGGFTNPKLENMNIVYNSLQNKWVSYSAYSESPYGDRQIFYGSASYVPGKGAAFYGGFEVYVNPNYALPYTNASIFTFSNGQSSTIGYTQVSYFNVDNDTPTWNTPVPLTIDVEQFSSRHASLFDPVTNLLFIMGGEYRRSNPPSITALSRPYTYVKAFNTETNVWSFVNLTGDAPTSGRMYSTLTLLPSTNRHVLLYGGEDGGAVSLDYCFVLNLDTKNWTRQTIDAPVGTTLARSRHSSVVVDNNTLFVMWGIDGNKVGISSVLILNITNPDAITLSANYTALHAVTADTDGHDQTAAAAASVDQGLSSGAKAGIAVAFVVVAILGALVIWFCIRNKKKNKRQEQELAEQQTQSEYYNRVDVEPMEVDWDQIENNYTEIPPSNPATTTQADRFVASPLSVGSATLVNGGNNASSATPAIHPDSNEIHRPHTIESPQPPRVAKPDGGY